MDLTKAYGSKILDFNINKNEVVPIYLALKGIYNKPNNYVLFEMCLEEEREETLSDIKEMITEFEALIS